MIKEIRGNEKTTGSSSKRCPEFDSWRLLDSFLFFQKWVRLATLGSGYDGIESFACILIHTDELPRYRKIRLLSTYQTEWVLIIVGCLYS